MYQYSEHKYILNAFNRQVNENCQRKPLYTCEKNEEGEVIKSIARTTQIKVNGY